MHSACSARSLLAMTTPRATGATPQNGHLDTSQAARRLNVSDSTVRRWIAAGTLPAKRVGERSWRIDPADLELMVTPSRRSQPLTEDSAELLRTRTEDTTR